jgi:hypothetical protein
MVSQQHRPEERVSYSLEPDGPCVLGDQHDPIEADFVNLSASVISAKQFAVIKGLICRKCGVPLHSDHCDH